MINQRLYAYGPYTLEIDIWADLFPELVIAAPCHHEQPPGDCLPFTKSNISILPQKETGGNNLISKLTQIIALPKLLVELTSAMKSADAIHVRCPGNLGMLGAILAPCFSNYMIAKYAGNWKGQPGEPWTYRLQRKILSSRWWRGPVTVYGLWSNQSKNIVPFFTSILTKVQLKKAKEAASHKKFQSPLRVIFVGRLTKEKNVDKVISAIDKLNEQGIPVTCKIIGKGPMRSALEEQVSKACLWNNVAFVGGVGLDKVLNYYENADVLVLISETEGWPKAIAEAMAFGLICIGSDIGWVPEMLGNGRGIVIPSGDVQALTDALCDIAETPQVYMKMSERAAAWAERFSLEGLREALRDLLSDRWNVPLESEILNDEGRRNLIHGTD